jgi:hypothetical protein
MSLTTSLLEKETLTCFFPFRSVGPRMIVHYSSDSGAGSPHPPSGRAWSAFISASDNAKSWSCVLVTVRSAEMDKYTHGVAQLQEVLFYPHSFPSRHGHWQPRPLMQICLHFRQATAKQRVGLRHNIVVSTLGRLHHHRPPFWSSSDLVCLPAAQIKG